MYLSLLALFQKCDPAYFVSCVAGGILSRVRGQREAMAAEPPILAAKRLRRPYSLSTVKIFPRTRTIPPATQATFFGESNTGDGEGGQSKETVCCLDSNSAGEHEPYEEIEGIYALHA